MKTIKLLLGNSEVRFGNLIETLVRKGCADQAILECTRVAESGDLAQKGCEGAFDLIIAVPEKVRPDRRPQGTLGPFGETVRAISAIKAQRTTPVIALLSKEQEQAALIEAGADYVVGVPFNCEELKALVRQVLALTQPAAGAVPTRWSFAEALIRGFHRLTQS
ncbi:hypothetical protein SBV1_670004 [Verrucomicrobia bacterium]|nr:hypothetical protein SBV1_670004 [Verrucomicrobiota bacterium]